MQDANVSANFSRPESAQPRLRTADRSQTDPFPKSINELIPDVHPARDVWEMVRELDYSQLLDQIKSVQGRPGRPTIDPRVLAALWIYATIEGISAARQLAKSVQFHDAFKWIAGGVSVNYHTLSDFRVNHNQWLEEQVIQIVVALKSEGLIELKDKDVGQDGMRVRASAGSSSLKKEEKLDQLLDQAQKQWDALEAEFQQGDGGSTKRQQAAARRAARERLERIERAKQQRDQIAAAREARKKGDGQLARASTTDPEARRMKMADGGFRPAYNFQYSTLLDSLLIVAVDVVNAGSDGGQILPMVDQIEKTYGQLPDSYYVDGGFSTKADIESVMSKGITVYAPVKQSKGERDRYAARKSDSPLIAAWRALMGSEQGQQAYRKRCICEWSNAESRRHGIERLTVRGLLKAKAVALWHALVQNLLRAKALRAAV